MAAPAAGSQATVAQANPMTATVAAPAAAPAADTAPAQGAAPTSSEAGTKARTPAVAKGAKKPDERPTRSAAETEKIRVALSERLAELRAEYDQTMAEIAEAQRDRLTDSAGDDQADTGTKTFEREQEITLANNVRERMGQVERALDRLDDGQYGWCERCGNAIPVERLAAFPSATLCVTCKQLEERR
jgi:DnaK suppressor protein